MITLEYFGKKDFAQLIEWINSEYLLTNWAGSLFRYPLTEDSLEWYIADTNDPETSDALIYKVTETETNKVIGHVSLGSISRKNKAARISRVLISEDARGKGYCCEIIQKILRIGFEDLQLHRISLGVYDFNHSAIRCYEKCGFTKEGLSRDVLQYEDNTYWSLVEMGILENEWREKNQKAQQ